MRWTVALLIAVGCETVPPPACPEGVELTDADLPCDCQGATVENLTCGGLVCDASGLSMATTTTTGCTTTSPGDTGP